MKSLTEIVKSGRFHPTVRLRLEQAEAGAANGPESEACKAEMSCREQVRAAVNKAMDAQKIDAWVYPTWSNPPRFIDDLNTPGDNSQFFSPTTGFPSIQVPMGYTRGGRRGSPSSAARGRSRR
jgi:amidase